MWMQPLFIQRRTMGDSFQSDVHSHDVLKRPQRSDKTKQSVSQASRMLNYTLPSCTPRNDGIYVRVAIQVVLIIGQTHVVVFTYKGVVPNVRSHIRFIVGVFTYARVSTHEVIRGKNEKLDYILVKTVVDA